MYIGTYDVFFGGLRRGLRLGGLVGAGAAGWCVYVRAAPVRAACWGLAWAGAGCCLAALVPGLQAGGARGAQWEVIVIVVIVMTRHVTTHGTHTNNPSSIGSSIYACVHSKRAPIYRIAPPS